MPIKKEGKVAEKYKVIAGLIVTLIIVIVLSEVISIDLGKKYMNWSANLISPPDSDGITPPPYEEDREWEIVDVPGTKCGDGNPYFIIFSEGPLEINGEPNSRVVIWLPGGGSTQIDLEGNLDSAIGSLQEIRSLTQGPDRNAIKNGASFGGAYIFLNSPDNDAFVRDAHWAVFPYCTQDFHSGNKTEVYRYDFTGVSKIVNQIETLINVRGKTVEQIQNVLPNLEIQGSEAVGNFNVDRVFLTIIHDGARNVKLGLDKLFVRLQSTGFNLDNADILMSGSSAGGFGTWYNAWRIGDLLYGYPDARFTIDAQSGSPSIREWNGEDLEFVQEELDELLHRLSWQNVNLPCQVPGSNYNGNGQCYDVLDLVDHYNERWLGMDFQIATIVNKEDLIAVAGLGNEGEPGFEAKLLNLCRGIHRYSQYIYLTENSNPYTAWIYERNGRGYKRVHGFKNGIFTAHMLSPDGQGRSEYSALSYVNAVASRTINRDPAQIENILGVVIDPGDLNSRISPQPDHLPECNVSWPSSGRPA